MSTTELYRHFDKDGTLLYVGISLTTTKRAGEHRRGSAWWSQVASITIERFATRGEALEAEARAIRTENPPHNRMGKGPRKEKLTTVYVTASQPAGSLAAYFRARGLLKEPA